MRISLFLMVFIITFSIFSASTLAEGELISGDTVYINDSNVYLSAYPHTLSESGYVYFNLTSKQYSGDIDFFFGFDEHHCKPISAEVFIDGGWIDISNRFRYIQYYFGGMYNWYYLNEIPIYSDTDYTLRAYLQINEISIGGKYGVAVKPSSETLSQSIDNGHFYYLDPWYDGNYLYRQRITLTGNTSGAQTDYQLLLNVTYDSDMQIDFDDLRFTNETHQIDAWLEFNTTDYALVWVEFPTTPANTIKQYYYMYYGNTEAISDWNGTTTFLFFDDTEARSNSDLLISYGWTQDSGSGGKYSTTRSKYGNIGIELSSSDAEQGYHKTPNISLPYTIEYWTYSTTPDVSSIIDSWVWVDTVVTAAILDGYNTVNWQLYHGGYYTSSTVVTSGWHHVKLDAKSDGSGDVYIDGNLLDISFPVSTITAGEIGIRKYMSTGKGFFDNIFKHKYVANPPTYIFGDEEKQLYIPPNPTNLQNTTGDFCINHTWHPGSGNVTDSYNVSINNVWHNETINTYWNITYGYGNDSWQNITIWAYNKSGIGSLSIGNISQNTHLLFTNLPINLRYVHNHFWVNWAWDESYIGTHTIDTYNVSINDTWYNSTTNQSYNHSGLDYELISSIIVYGYNNTIGLSVYYISDSYTFPIKNKIIKCLQQIPEALTLLKDKFFRIVPFIIAIILFAGFGLAIITITSKIKRW